MQYMHKSLAVMNICSYLNHSLYQYTELKSV
uniref:Uncharacterized protein n=1 Tax=Anguilla anguilla TaxID=7936 RepID=A0A0E9TGS4_ANGAN